MNSSPAKPVDWNVEDEDLYNDQYQDNYEDELDEDSDEDEFDDNFGNEDEEEDDADVEQSPAQRKRKDRDFDDEKDRNERRAPARSTSTKARGVRIPPILYKAATLYKLSRASVKIFEEEVVSRMEAYLKSDALLVSENFKHQFDDLEVRRAEINPAVKSILSRLRGACGDRIHESMGIDTGTKKEALPLLWLRLCKGYDVPFTTKRAYRVAVLRWIAADVSVRQKDGKPTGKFWKTVDATIENLQKRQDQQPEEIKKPKVESRSKLTGMLNALSIQQYATVER
ncbi:unnamed protein product [Tilletia controversa]|nr:unnamed protein product [Tilletia controversa]